MWDTKNREPIITPDIEDHLHGFIAKKAIGLGGIVYTLNGTIDHVYLAVTIPISISISRFIGQIKAVASSKLNKSNLGNGNLYWQLIYSIFSFGEKVLPNIIRYIENQKQHHSDGTIVENLEIQ